MSFPRETVYYSVLHWGSKTLPGRQKSLLEEQKLILRRPASAQQSRPDPPLWGTVSLIWKLTSQDCKPPTSPSPALFVLHMILQAPFS